MELRQVQQWWGKNNHLYILIKKVLGFARGKRVITNKRLINEKSVWRAFILVVLKGTLVLVGTFLLLIFDNKGLEVSLFEVISAFGNVGLTINLTLLLSMGSKIVLAIIMLIGRVGPLTFILMLNKNWNQDETEKIDYLEEQLIIG